MTDDLIERLETRAKAAREEGNMTANCDAQHFEEAAARIRELEQGVEVKRLKWDVDGRKLRFDDTMAFGKGYDWDAYECLRQEGYGLASGYIIWPEKIGGADWCLYGTNDGLFITELAGEEAAKAAAQADYEARIRSTLTPTPVTKGFYSGGMWIQITDDGTCETPTPYPVTDEARDYLVWSNVHRGWWAPDSAGYRYSIRGAGLYTRDEALTIAHKARDGWHGDAPPTEIAVALADLPYHVRALAGQGGE